jgi:hypothetical protein
MVNFLTIYSDDTLSKSIVFEVLQLIYYGKISYKDIMLLMSYKDRAYWLGELKKIIREQNSSASAVDADDPDIISKLNQLNRNN